MVLSRILAERDHHGDQKHEVVEVLDVLEVLKGFTSSTSSTSSASNYLVFLISVMISLGEYPGQNHCVVAAVVARVM
jgi:hypothetical protein